MGTSDSNHSTIFIVLAVVAFTKNEEGDTQAKKRHGGKQNKHNLLVSIVTQMEMTKYRLIFRTIKQKLR